MVKASTPSKITKCTLVKDIASAFSVTQEDATDIVDNVLQELEKTLARGRSAKIMGFGRLSPVLKKERPGRNPKTGETHIVSARTTILFRPSEYIRKKLKNN